MDMKKIVFLFIILNCSLSCSDSHKEPEENENPDNTTTIYDLFPNYNSYSHLYFLGYAILENLKTHKHEQFPVEDAGLLLKEANTEWKIPNDAPYLFIEYFSAIRLINPSEVCYKEVLAICPKYFYYEGLYRIKRLFELENTVTKERQQFEINNAEKLLRNPNKEWKIPNDAPYSLDSGLEMYLRVIPISEMCRAISNEKS